jgi:hypothetical protein
MSIFGSLFGKDRRGGSPEHQLFLAQAREELRLKTQAHDGTWGLGSADWSVEQDAGTIVFTSAEKGLTATCAVQIIGTYNTDDGTWLWGWDHRSVAAPLQQHARRLKAYGEERGIAALTTRKLACEEAEAWDFAALACKLCEAQGAYRGPAGSTLVFMTFGEVRLGK